MMEKLLELKDVNVNYYGGYNGCCNVTFSLEKGQHLCVLGDRMSGKSSLIKGIVGLEPFTGKILLDGKDISKISIHDRNFGLTMSLPKKGNVLKTLKYPLKLRKLSKNEIDKKINAIANVFDISGILDSAMKHLDPVLSVFVELARLFIIDREIYFIDNIMEKVYITDRRILFPHIMEIIKKLNKTVIFTTDLLEELEQVNADVNVFLSYNKMIDRGQVNEVMKAPSSLDLAKFLYCDKLTLFEVDINRDGVYYNGKFVASKVALINNVFSKAIAMIMPSCIRTARNGDAKGIVNNIVNSLNGRCAVIQNNSTIVHAIIDEGDVEIGKEIEYKIDWKKAIYYDNNSEMIISKR